MPVSPSLLRYKSPISTLIFDFGGVIINLELDKCIEKLNDLGVQHLDQYLSHYGHSDFFLDWERGTLDIQGFRNKIRALSVLNPTDEEIDAAWGRFLTDIPLERLDLLLELRKKFRVIMLSNTNPIHIEQSARKEFQKAGLTMEDYFDKCYLSYEMGMTKPDVGIFEKLLKEEGIAPESCLFLDDGIKNIRTAEALGIPSYWVQPGESLDFLHHINDPKDEHTATVGFFDGVHTGHQFLINELKNTARERNQKSMIITFPVHPRKVLHATYQPQLLTTPEEKTEILLQTAVDELVIKDFTEHIAQLSAYDFLKNIISEQLNVKTLLVGHDHRFGHNRAESFEDYKRYGESLGIEVIQAARYETETIKHISSSDIRLAIENGDVEKAAQILGYTYSFKGKVVRGFSVGNKIGFPTANLQPVHPDKQIPGMGVYAVEVIYQNRIMPGMMNIGYRPTLENGTHTSLEVHILHFEEDIYHQELCVRFIQKLRDEQKFADISELIDQLEKDKMKVEEIFNNR